MRETSLFDNVCRYVRREGLSIYSLRNLYKNNKLVSSGKYLFNCITVDSHWLSLCRVLVLYNVWRSTHRHSKDYDTAMLRDSVFKEALKQQTYNPVYQNFPLEIILLTLPVEEQNIFCMEILVRYSFSKVEPSIKENALNKSNYTAKLLQDYLKYNNLNNLIVLMDEVKKENELSNRSSFN